jgi:hypothetical protein
MVWPHYYRCRPPPQAFAHIFRMAGLSMRHPQRNGLRLALPKRPNGGPIGSPFLTLLSQSQAATAVASAAIIAIFEILMVKSPLFGPL